MDSNSDAVRRAEQVIRLAACHRPNQLKAKALAFLEAFILAHEALMVQGQLSIEEAAQSRCPDCLADLASRLGSYATIASDIGILQSAHEAINAIDGEFDRPPTEILEATSAELRDCASAVDTSAARLRFERLLHHPDASDAA